MNRASFGLCCDWWGSVAASWAVLLADPARSCSVSLGEQCCCGLSRVAGRPCTLFSSASYVLCFTRVVLRKCVGWHISDLGISEVTRYMYQVVSGFAVHQIIKYMSYVVSDSDIPQSKALEAPGAYIRPYLRYLLVQFDSGNDFIIWWHICYVV